MVSRREYLFAYDVRRANPNGDPIDENRPRQDPITEKVLVSDVRLKRTIRDWWINEGKEVFIKREEKEDGSLMSKEERLSSLNIKDRKELLQKCIDIRLFGATTAIKKQTITLTGPVQFLFGSSLHPVEVEEIHGTTVMPSGSDKKQGTMTQYFIVKYALISFYGVFNEAQAEEVYKEAFPNNWEEVLNEDLHSLVKAMWYGTKNLITRSKHQNPRLLLEIIHKSDSKLHIGDLDLKIKFVPENSKSPKEIESLEEFHLEISDLIDTLNKNSERIEKIRYKIDPELKITLKGEPKTLNEALEVVKVKEVEELNF